MNQRTEELGLVLLAGLALGSSIVVTRIGVSEIPPLMLVTLRFGVATITYAAVILLTRRALPSGARTWRDMVIVGITATGAPLVLFTMSLQYISSGVFTIILSLVPAFTGVLAHLFLAQEKLTLRKAGGLMVALAGVVLIVVTRTTGLTTTANDFRGHLLALAGVVITTIGFIYARKQLKELDAVVVSGVQSGVALLVIAPIALALTTLDPAAVSARGWFAVFYNGLIGSFVGFLLLFLLLKRFGAMSSSLPGYVVPVVATFLGAILLQEMITAPLVIGAALVLGGVFLVSR